ncbi:MAG: pentapeptide repeat-containing protein, partial [Ignavibacteria bacterium]|nr:pentapeptide repeat-containing protein [Ignavibacteria bacterium]
KITSEYLEKFSIKSTEALIKQISLSQVVIKHLAFLIEHISNNDTFSEGYDLSYKYLCSIRLSIINWKKFNLENIFLIGADLQRADLREVQMYLGKLQNADLSFANLKGSNLSLSEFHGANLSNSEIEGAALFNTKFEGANLTGAMFDGSRFYKTNFDGAILVDVNFEGAFLNIISMQGAQLNRVYFDGTVINNPQFNGSVFIDVSFLGSKFESVNKSMILLEGNLKGEYSFFDKSDSDFEDFMNSEKIPEFNGMSKSSIDHYKGNMKSAYKRYHENKNTDYSEFFDIKTIPTDDFINMRNNLGIKNKYIAGNMFKNTGLDKFDRKLSYAWIQFIKNNPPDWANIPKE